MSVTSIGGGVTSCQVTAATPTPTVSQGLFTSDPGLAASYPPSVSAGLLPHSGQGWGVVAPPTCRLVGVGGGTTPITSLPCVVASSSSAPAVMLAATLFLCFLFLGGGYGGGGGVTVCGGEFVVSYTHVLLMIIWRLPLSLIFRL